MTRPTFDELADTKPLPLLPAGSHDGPVGRAILDAIRHDSTAAWHQRDRDYILSRLQRRYTQTEVHDDTPNP